MDQTQGSDMERLWALLSELSAQLSHNRQQTEELHRRADELKVRAGPSALEYCSVSVYKTGLVCLFRHDLSPAGPGGARADWIHAPPIQPRRQPRCGALVTEPVCAHETDASYISQRSSSRSSSGSMSSS